jgi:hypothetical protein
MAQAEGFGYTDLINEILDLALDRHAKERKTDGRTHELFQRLGAGAVAPAWHGL